VPKGNRSTKQLYTVVTWSKVTFRHEALINGVIADLDLAANGWRWCGCRGTRDDWLRLPFLCAWFSPILIDRCLSACVYR